MKTMNMNVKTNVYMPEDHMDRLYSSKNPLVSFVHNQRLDAIVNLIPINSHCKILDAGGGEGHLIQRLHRLNKKNEYHLIDITKVALNKAKRRCPYAKIKKMDLTKINYPNDFFDVIIMTEVIEHIVDYNNVISELKRVLAENGLLIITFPNEVLWTISRLLLLRRPIKVPDHVNSFNPSLMKRTLKLNCLKQVNLPFKLPFCLSLNCVLKLKK